VQTARQAGARTLELNLDRSAGSHRFDESRLGPASELVPLVQSWEAAGIEGVWAPQIFGAPFTTLAAAAAVTTHTEGVDSSLYILLLRRFRLFETSALPECDDSDLVADIASKGQMLNKSNRSNARKNFILLYAIICIARQMRDSLEGNVYRLVALLRFL
jgi:hypothetical protein